jgi:hypothetical protein
VGVVGCTVICSGVFPRRINVVVFSERWGQAASWGCSVTHATCPHAAGLPERSSNKSRPDARRQGLVRVSVTNACNANVPCVSAVSDRPVARACIGRVCGPSCPTPFDSARGLGAASKRNARHGARRRRGPIIQPNMAVFRGVARTGASRAGRGSITSPKPRRSRATLRSRRAYTALLGTRSVR